MTFTASFRSVVITALLVGLSANAAPGGTPGSPSSSTGSNLSNYGVCEAYSKHSRLGETLHVQIGHVSNLVERAKYGTEGFPDPTTDITAYHGTVARRLGSLQQGVKIYDSRGDHSKHGGFYLTPSFRSAGQWSCYGRGENVDYAYIFEYSWDSTNATVKPYSEWQSEEEYENFCNANYCDHLKYESAGMTDKEKEDKLTEFERIPKNYDMLEGPMLAVKDIGSKFWQYTVVRNEGLKHLKQVHVYKVPCKYFPKGEGLEMKDTFGPSDKFSEQDRKAVGLTDDEADKIV